MDWSWRQVQQRGASLRHVAAGAVVVCLLMGFPEVVNPDVPAARYSKRDIIRTINWCAAKYRLDPLLLRAVVKAESDFRQDARSQKGAMGLMQIMPGTAARYRVSDPFDPPQNIRAGARQLRHLLHLYDGDVPMALAAYNAGVSRAKGHRVPRIKETRRYVRKVVAYYQDFQRLYRRPLGPPRPSRPLTRTIREAREAATEQASNPKRGRPTGNRGSLPAASGAGEGPST